MTNCRCCGTKQELSIYNINLSLVDDIELNNMINIYYCEECNFFYSDSNNNQNDYDNYYKTFNNYKNYVIYSDKDERCNLYLQDKLENVNNILDYGSGNGELKKLLSEKYVVDEYDIGMPKNIKKYDCLILSHVLEHIYNINEFINKIKFNINENGLLYIEVPNSEFYDKIAEITPLQEINIEHINFFSKFSLNKLLVKYGFHTVSLIDDYFKIKDYKYYVIRGIFKKNTNNVSLKNYIDQGINTIYKYNFCSLKKYNNIYIYGCGQFLFKIFDIITANTNIINIIDDNPCYLNKKIKNVNIINYETYEKICTNDDVILLTTLIYDDIIKKKLNMLEKNLTVLSVNDL